MLLTSPNDQKALLAFAAGLQDGGDAEAAAWVFRRALASVPADWASDARCARACAATGDHAGALRAADRALAQQPADAAMLALRAGALWQLGRLDEALATWQSAAAAAPGHPVILLSLGAALAEAGRHAEAVRVLGEAVALAPDDMDARLALAASLEALGRDDDLAAELEAVLGRAPGNLFALDRLAGLCRRRGDAAGTSAAAAALVEGDRLEPWTWRQLAQAALDLGAPERVDAQLARLEAGTPDPQMRHACAEGWQGAGEFDRAARLYADAVAANGTESRGISRKALAHMLARLGRLDAAEAEIAQAEAELGAAARRLPHRPDVLLGLASILVDRGRPEEALAVLDAARRIAPEDAGVNRWRAECLIACGHAAEGWRERRKRHDTLAAGEARLHPAPRWQGEVAPDKLLVLSNRGDGLGDFLQFSRYVPLAARRCRVVLHVPPALLPLTRTLPGPERVVADTGGLVAGDLHCPIADLPSVIGVPDEGLPGLPPYLRAEPSRVAAFQARLAHLPGLRVGIVWQGNRDLNWDFARSIPAERLAALAEVPGVSFVSLQKGEATPGWMFDLSEELSDLGETAAAIEALDLVIAVDSAVAHLTGALGRPLWLLNRFNAEFRWPVGRDDNDWYPSARIFRQPRLGDWEEVLGRVRAALAAAPSEEELRAPRAGAAQAHQAGNPMVASHGYQRILAHAPADADTLHLLALALLARGEAVAALARVDQALRHAPHRSDFLDTRANALRRLARLEEAVAAWRACLAADPEQPQVWFNLGAALADAHRFEDAAACQREAVQRDPSLFLAHFALAAALTELGRKAEAETPLRAALALDPAHHSALNNLGLVLRDTGQLEEALSVFGRLVSLEPDWGESWAALAGVAASLGRPEAVGAVLATLGPVAQSADVLHAAALGLMFVGRLAEAEAMFAAAIRRDRLHGRARHMHALLLARLGRAEQAMAALASAERDLAAAFPKRAGRRDLPLELAVILYDLNRPTDSVAWLDAALQDDPTHHAARGLRAECLVAAGRDAEGWAERDSRLRVPGNERSHPAPQWDGSAAPDKLLLLTNERDGIGDFLQFCRFVPRAAAACRVVLQVAPNLLRLARTLAGPERVIATTEGLVPADLHCPVPSLPTVLRLTAETIPAEVPYLHADPALVAAWRERLGHLNGLRVGVAWQGNRGLSSDFLRSIPSGDLEALAGVPGVRFVSLQLGETVPPWMLDVSADLTDLAETAALMQALDLIVCVDSGLAHLAGALARPVWMLSRRNSEWRWQMGREDSPWYPTMRIWRQARLGDWGELLGRVRAALAEEAATAAQVAGADPLADLFAQAQEAHLAGDLYEAEQLYRGIILTDPEHADALHALSMIARDTGKLDAAFELVGRALSLRPEIGEYLDTLGRILLAAGRVEDAVQAHQFAVERNPRAAPLHIGLGLALSAAGRHEAALAAFADAAALDPKQPLAHAGLGAAALALGRTAESVAAFRTQAALAPGAAQARFNLGSALQADGAAAEAAEALRAAIALDPAHAAAHGNLGLALQALGQLEEAEAALRSARQLQPGPRADYNLGNVLRDQRRLHEAAACYRAVIAAEPSHHKAHLGLADTFLLAGRLPEGWEEYEWRSGDPATALQRPGRVWGGEDLAGGTLLLVADGGFGDFLQFCRYLPLAAARARVVVEVPTHLLRLAAAIPGVAAAVPLGTPVPDVAAYCRILSLGRVFGTTLETIPARVPYLAPAPDAVSAWQSRLAVLPGRRVGLAWAGNARYEFDRQRSVPEAALAALAGIEGVSFVSLQVPPRGPAPLPMADCMAELRDFADTAALVAALDLVIAVDTGVAHLAGALARPVWLLDRFAPDWRWLLGRTDSPWYPTLRIVRQAAPGDWEGVLARVRAALVAGAAWPEDSA